VRAFPVTGLPNVLDAVKTVTWPTDYSVCFDDMKNRKKAIFIGYWEIFTWGRIYPQPVK